MGWADDLASGSTQQPSSSWAAELANTSTQPAPTPKSHSYLDDLKRQLGLFGRDAWTAATALPTMVGDGVNGAINLGIALTGSKVKPLQMPSQVVQQGIDASGLPQPQGSLENIVNGATTAGLSLVQPYVAAGAAPQIAKTTAQKIAASLRANPGNQAVAATTAGASAAGAKEAGLGPLWQMGAGALGGMAGSMGAGMVAAVPRAAVRTLGAVAPETAEAIAPGSVPTNAPNAASNGVAAANGEMPAAITPSAQDATTLAQRTSGILNANPGANPAAAARLADFHALGLVGDNGPTLGMISRDPAQFSVEQNYRADGGNGVAARMNTLQTNMARFLRTMAPTPQEALPAGDTIGQGLATIDNNLKGAVSKAYTDARSSNAAGSELNIGGLASDYGNILRNYANDVPPGLQNQFEDYGLMGGKQTKVMTYDDAESLLKAINSFDGPMANPGTQSALGALRNAVKTAITTGGTEGDPFSQARTLAAQRFALHEQVPALDAVVNGKYGNVSDPKLWSPDGLVRQYVTGGPTTGLKNMMELLQQNGQTAAANEVRAQLSGNLNQSAFGFNPAGDKSATAARYAKALTSLGTDRLESSFTPAEIDDLKRFGRVSSYINDAPSGAWVNRSNTGVMGADLLSNLPFVGKAASSLDTRLRLSNALKADINKAP